MLPWGIGVPVSKLPPLHPGRPSEYLAGVATAVMDWFLDRLEWTGPARHHAALRIAEHVTGAYYRGGEKRSVKKARERIVARGLAFLKACSADPPS